MFANSRKKVIFSLIIWIEKGAELEKNNKNLYDKLNAIREGKLVFFISVTNGNLESFV